MSTTVHVAGPVQLGGLYQQCARCGYVLQDYTGGQVMVPEGQASQGIPAWAVGGRVAVDGGAKWVVLGDAPLDVGQVECQPVS